MLTLLNPTALLSLTGLLVPVAIHLWNRRPGREVAVGSLRWLAAGANRRLRNLKLEQLWLLLLRAALLAALAVAVTGPLWRQQLPASRGVVLLSPEVLRLPALDALRPAIDSLRRRGYALRWLREGFPRVSSRQWRAAGGADSVPAAGAAGFAWARVQQAVGVFPGQPLYVVTTAALRDFQGTHVPPSAVTWQLLPDTASSSWLQAAAIRGKRGDSLRLLVGRSKATQTTFRTATIGYRNEPHEQFRVANLPALRLDTLADNSRTTFALVPVKPGSGLRTPIDCGTPPQVIEIYASPAYARDAHYLEAALRAAATGLLNPPLLRRLATRPDHLQAYWTFWLSDEPLPKGERSSSSHIWREAAGPGVADTARLATTETQAAPITVFRRGTELPSDTREPGWVDGRGRPLLSRQTGVAGIFYQLHTHLDPAWSTLADAPQLPARLLRLLQPTPTDEGLYAVTELDRQLAQYDQRTLDPAQLTTSRQAQAAAPSRVLNQRITDLQPWLVLVAGLLLLLERLLARRRENQALTSSIVP
ncbi:BatA domain-containing protein [Hymenobacter negativus]|uniref:BatA domain-containing protein n=1 Tax=Hymenobacter negativus TaxID=2795026 RepID=A0ABS3QCJ1_9BACT|nr:BatA domain-containing protein [Hymenobacter negativus]MBO2008926.1 BatA domain-containing protein [Hymenobacter negativus]